VELGCGDAGLKLQAVVGCARERKLGYGASGLKRRRREGSKKRVFLFFKHTQTMNSNKSLNSNTQKRCTSMYATGNSYISLIN
jgi:hypothetical protein